MYTGMRIASGVECKFTNTRQVNSSPLNRERTDYEAPVNVRQFLDKSTHWVLYRIRIRLPALMARIAGELPLRPAENVYTEALSRDSRIPNIVHQTWPECRFGRSHLSAIEQFRKENADFTFRFYNDEDLDAYMEAHWKHHGIYHAYRGALFGPLKTDIWRYCILYDQGGVYCDIGKAIGWRLSSLIPPQADLIVSWERRGVSGIAYGPTAGKRLQHPDRTMINWAIMATPKHPLLKRAIEGIASHYPDYRAKTFEDPKDAIVNFTGPAHLTRCLIDAAEAGELEGAIQVGIEFEGCAIWELPGSWVRYARQPAYALERSRQIVI